MTCRYLRVSKIPITNCLNSTALQILSQHRFNPCPGDHPSSRVNRLNCNVSAAFPAWSSLNRQRLRMLQLSCLPALPSVVPANQPHQSVSTGTVPYCPLVYRYRLYTTTHGPPRSAFAFLSVSCTSPSSTLHETRNTTPELSL